MGRMHRLHQRPGDPCGRYWSGGLGARPQDRRTGFADGTRHPDPRPTSRNRASPQRQTNATASGATAPGAGKTQAQAEKAGT